MFAFPLLVEVSTIFISQFKKWFKFILSFVKLLGENKFVKSVKLLPWSIKSINQKQKYSHKIKSYVCILNIFFVMFLIPITCLISLGMCSNLELSKYFTLITIYIYSNPMSSHWFLLIEIYYICSILCCACCTRQAISGINNIKSILILIKSSYFKIV